MAEQRHSGRKQLEAFGESKGAGSEVERGRDTSGTETEGWALLSVSLS